MLKDINDVITYLQSNFDVSRETISKLNNYVELLQKWNKKINLVRFKNLYEVWYRHILDSAQLILYINKNLKVADFGSGGGLPGIILSILGVEHIYLVESDVRKCAFLHQLANISPYKIEVINNRIEDLKEINADIITSRALCNVDKFLSLVARLNSNAKILLLKGKSIKKEIEEARINWDFNYSLHQSITSTDSFIVEIFNLKYKYNE